MTASQERSSPCSASLSLRLVGPGNLEPAVVGPCRQDRGKQVRSCYGACGGRSVISSAIRSRRVRSGVLVRARIWRDRGGSRGGRGEFAAGNRIGRLRWRGRSGRNHGASRRLRLGSCRQRAASIRAWQQCVTPGAARHGKVVAFIAERGTTPSSCGYHHGQHRITKPCRDSRARC